MKKRTESIWTDDACFDTASPDGLRGLSLVLFRIGNGSVCNIVAARCPTQEFTPGMDLCRVLQLDRETRQYLGRLYGPARAIRTSLGVGMFSLRLALSAETGLYIHFHAPADAVAAILYNRLLPGTYELSEEIEEVGCGMTAAYERVFDKLLPVWNELLALGQSSPFNDELGSVTPDELIPWISRVAAAVGCGLRTVRVGDRPTDGHFSYRPPKGELLDRPLTRREKNDLYADLDARYAALRHRDTVSAACRDVSAAKDPDPGSEDMAPADARPEGAVTRLRWFVGGLWEGFLLYSLMQARMYDPERSLSCLLAAFKGREDVFLDMTISFSMIAPEPAQLPEERGRFMPVSSPHLPEDLCAGFSLFEHAMAFNDSYFILINGEPERAPFDLHAWVYPVTARLAFFYDVTILSDGDIKTDPEFADDWPEPRGSAPLPI